MNGTMKNELYYAPYDAYNQMLRMTCIEGMQRVKAYNKMYKHVNDWIRSIA